MAAGVVRVCLGTSLTSPLTTFTPRSIAVRATRAGSFRPVTPYLPCLIKARASDGGARAQHYAVVFAQDHVDVLVGHQQIFHRLEAAFVIPVAPALTDHGQIGLAELA